jgi:hypothetical protein
MGRRWGRRFGLATAVCVAISSVALTPAVGRSSGTTIDRPSFVYPPDGVKWFPLRVAGSRPVKGAHGFTAQIVELRGWLTFVADRCYSEPKALGTPSNQREPDWHYNLELDPAWLDHLGIKDPNVIIRPGNVINWAARVPQPGDHLGHETGPLATPSAWGIVSRPIVHVEVTSWDPARHRGEHAPAGWQTLRLPGCATDVRWPYDPRNPVPGQTPLAPGQYVRMVGSLVTDDPHVRITAEEPDYAQANRDIHGILGGDDATTLAVRLFWERGRPEDDPANSARWTELHPPDTVEVLTPRPRAEVLRSVLVATPSDLASGATFTFDATLPVPEPRSPDAAARVVEIVGSATRPRRLQGLYVAPNTSRVTVTSSGIQIHIAVTRHGTATTPSAFQAAYRISP